MEEFISGQRWISHAELQLGLGTIVATEHRTVTIVFKASDETRTYAKQNAPLTRVIYDKGEQVKSVAGDSLNIQSISNDNGLITYVGINDQGEALALPEADLDHFIQLNRPAERLFTGQIDKNNWFNLRYQTLKHNNQLAHSQLSGLTGVRTSLIAHQLYIAHEVANRYAPRVLLADEVGLGKTIEAGLILHHQLLNERAQRVLIIVPESLVHQWLVEMLRRFNLMFSIFDTQRIQAMQNESEDESVSNPFLSEQLVLCSLEFLANNETSLNDALAGEWDLIVVDEAHHLQWTPEKSSHEYQIIEQLAEKIRGILLLTATPEQLGVASHFARLRLLDPDRFPDLQSFIAEEESYQPVAQVMSALISGEPIDPSLFNTLDSDSQAIISDVLDKNKAQDEAESDAHRQAAITQMLDRHGTGRVLFRNTRATVKGFPQRQVIAHPQVMPKKYEQSLQIFCQQMVAQAPDSIEESFSNLLLFPELLYQLQDKESATPDDWTHIDPRVQWLGDWLLDLKQENFSNNLPVYDNKTLVIAANATTAIALANTLKQRFGLYAAVFHEGMSLIERDKAAAFFADAENGSPVLICSEIGSEGRNFQFAHKMVLFDLPLNPDLLEQRIGRLDRIGQSQNIQIHVPYLEHSAQENLFHWFNEGLNAFEQTCPAGHNVFEQVQQQLKTDLIAASLNEDIFSEQLSIIEKTQSLHQALNESLHNGRDRLLEYNSCRQPQANQLTTLAEQADHNDALRLYMEALFDTLGIEHSDHSEHCYIIAPGEHMLHPFPGLPEDGMTLTYDRATALANEDIHFFTWEHPMVKTAMDMINSSEMGNTAITTLDSQLLRVNITPGSMILECIFILATTAHKSLQADRYLPSSSIRILLDERGQNIAHLIKHDDIIMTDKIKKQIAQQIIKAKDPELRQMITQAEAQCQQQVPELIASAKTASQQTLLDEVKRLSALAQVNPNIRQEEIEFYQQQLTSLKSIFSTLKPRLDALRVIIIT
ncbi:RNA polymerase-associated protein RapA [sulfur-oxidizing endosymbiont of Gigantopelta aegis]|uniref:RNA polymerase-associated protein RapA n=1 Tax=sulfur-oxidizing endosymbiont of Gigantopelta aegis TaxID=2794934 RepID=UPI0018DE10DC|nr:RNA polymerase-associated protein RapA [sulfur-oxidizing endosymbiont of Gigantopelta aegis]